MVRQPPWYLVYTGASVRLPIFAMFRGGKSTQKNPPKIKSSFEQVFLNNFRRVPDSRHRGRRQKFARTFRKSSCKRGVFFLVFRDFGWVFGPLNVLRDNCAILHKNKHERVLRYNELQASRDMKSIAAGPLRRACFPPSFSAHRSGRSTTSQGDLQLGMLCLGGPS